MLLKKASVALSLFVAVLALSVPQIGFSADKSKTYDVDTQASSIKWLGKKVTGQHDGHINIKSGELKVEKGTLTGGMFVVDTQSITVDDLKDEEYNAKLVGHLKSADFFDVENFPTAKFEIVKVEALDKKGKNGETHQITGDLTIKENTHPLSFPAKVKIEGKKVMAEASDVTVDRTLYDIRYGSGKFFQGLGDKLIYDDFNLDINLVAEK